LQTPEHLESTEFHLQISTEGHAEVAGGSIGALGRALGEFLQKGDYGEESVEFAPLEVRRKGGFERLITYWPVHFKNCYQQRDEEFLEDLLEERLLLGSDTLWLFFGPDEFESPFGPHANPAAARQLQKLQHLAQRASELGMQVGLVSCVNLVFGDQAKTHPEWQAKAHPQGPWSLKLVCAQHAEARQTLAENAVRLFEAFPQATEAVFFLYDWGGCGCEKCAPWLHTGLELAREQAAAVRKLRPELRVWIADWHFSEAEVAEVAEKPELIGEFAEGLVCTTRTEQFEAWKKSGFPEGLARLAFVDITMAGGWGLLGVNPLPQRMAEHYRRAQALASDGVTLYSEGIYDELNFVLFSALAWGRAGELEEVLDEWTRFHKVELSGADLLEYAAQFEARWLHSTEAWYAQKLRAWQGLPRELRQRFESLEVQDNWRALLFRASARVVEASAVLGSAPELEREARKLKGSVTEGGIYALEDAKHRLETFIQRKQQALKALDRALNNLRSRALQLPPQRWPEISGKSPHLAKIAGFNVKEWQLLLQQYQQKTLQRLERRKGYGT